MRKTHFTLFAAIILLSLAFISGCDFGGGTDNGNATLDGQVIDTTNGNIGVAGVKVTIMPANYVTTTDKYGFYKFGLLNEGTYTITATKYQFFPTVQSLFIYRADTAKLDIPMAFTFVYIYNNIILKHYIQGNPNTLSSLDLQRGIAVVEGDNTHKDIEYRDSLLRSADLDYENQGLETVLSEEFMPNFTQEQFNALSIYDVGNRPINPDVDFPYKVTQLFNTPLTKHSVYAFYLKGKYNGTRARIYGLLYFDSTWIDPSTNSRRLRVDAKINTNETNWFNPNPNP